VKWSGFWRGFPGITVANSSTLAKNASTIWGAAPVESVVIEKLDLKGATALVKCPQLSRFRVLEIKSYPPRRTNNEPIRTLFASPALSGLWWLAFTGNSHLDPEVMEWLANSESLRNLEMLTLRWCNINDDGANALAASPHLNKLRDLDLTGHEFTGNTPSVLRKRFPGVRL
jgi:hypothetical protein